MKFSEVTIQELKNYIRIEHDDEDGLLLAMLQGGRAHVRAYTGLTDEQLDTKDDVTIALMVLCSDMYENRITTIQGNSKANEVFKSILGSHSVNLL